MGKSYRQSGWTLLWTSHVVKRIVFSCHVFTYHEHFGCSCLLKPRDLLGVIGPFCHIYLLEAHREWVTHIQAGGTRFYYWEDGRNLEAGRRSDFQAVHATIFGKFSRGSALLGFAMGQRGT